MDPVMARLEMLDKEALRQRLQSRLGYKYDQADYLIQQAEYLFPFVICDEQVFRTSFPRPGFSPSSAPLNSGAPGGPVAWSEPYLGTTG